MAIINPNPHNTLPSEASYFREKHIRNHQRAPTKIRNLRLEEEKGAIFIKFKSNPLLKKSKKTKDFIPQTSCHKIDPHLINSTDFTGKKRKKKKRIFSIFKKAKGRNWLKIKKTVCVSVSVLRINSKKNN